MADSQDDKVFDVSKPGAGEPSSTSRPIIVGHKSMIEDPMVHAAASATLGDQAKDEETVDPTKVKAEKTEELAPHVAKTVAPLNATEATPPETPPAPEAAAPETSPISTPDTSQSAQAANVSDSLPDDPKPKEKEDKADDEEQAKEAAIQKLIEDKQFVVHVGEDNRHRSRRLLIIIAVVVLVVIAGTVALMMK